MERFTILALGAFLFSAPAGAGPFSEDRLDNWPQWRGPLACGAAPHGSPPVKWDENTNVRWKTPLPGRGSATPIVWGDRVFVLTAIDTGRKAEVAALPRPAAGLEKRTQPPQTYHRFVILCLDRRTGKVRWERTAAEQVPHEGHHPTHSYAAASPTTDGRYLYASFGSHGVYCYDLEGTLRWKRDLGRMETRLGWGEGSSPVLNGDTLVVNWDHEGPSFIVALDARTGKTRWRADRDEKTSWATPLVVEHKGRSQVIVNATKRVRSYDLATGKVLWECGGQTVNAIPSPVTDGTDVICMSGYRGAFACAIPLDSSGDVTDSSKVVWRSTRGTPYVPSPLLAGDRIYFTQGNSPQLTCRNAKTGAVLIDRERLPALSSLYASPVGAAGRVYVVGRDGTTVVIRQGDKLEVLAVNRLNDPTDASPAVAGDQLFLRGEKYLHCLEAD
jgi:outer membrane protein assembly factor BamB